MEKRKIISKHNIVSSISFFVTVLLGGQLKEVTAPVVSKLVELGAKKKSMGEQITEDEAVEKV